MEEESSIPRHGKHLFAGLKRTRSAGLDEEEEEEEKGMSTIIGDSWTPSTEQERVDQVWVRVLFTLQQIEFFSDFSSMRRADFGDLYTRIFNLCMLSRDQPVYEKMFLVKLEEHNHDLIQRHLESFMNDETIQLQSFFQLFSLYDRIVTAECKIFIYLSRYLCDWLEARGFKDYLWIPFRSDVIKCKYVFQRLLSLLVFELEALSSNSPESSVSLEDFEYILKILHENEVDPLRRFSSNFTHLTRQEIDDLLKFLHELIQITDEVHEDRIRSIQGFAPQVHVSHATQIDSGSKDDENQSIEGAVLAMEYD